MEKAELERFDPDGDIQEEEAEAKKYIYLTNKGFKELKKIQAQSTKKFLFWTGTGLLGGVAGASTIKSLPFKKELTIAKSRRYRLLTFFFISFPCSYHGYKLAVRDFKLEKRLLYDNPEYCIELDNVDQQEIED